MRLCGNCKVEPAVMDAHCVPCYDVHEPLPAPEWDRLVRPVTVAVLEERVAALEKRVAALEQIIRNRTADS